MDEIFISYAHTDNTPAIDQAGWIDCFQRELERTLMRYPGLEPKIWQDTGNIRRNDKLDQKITGVLSDSLVFLAMFSPSFFKSNWCPFELDYFENKAKSRPSLEIGERVFKVLLFPEQLTGHLPDIVNGKLGYEFFTGKKGGKPKQDDPWDFKELGPQAAEFLNRLADLAQDICRLINGPAANRKGTAYGARPTRDVNARYHGIVRELEARGYEVVPAAGSKLPENRERFEEEVSVLLKRSSLSIHLFGNREREENDPPGFTSRHVEYELAKKACQEVGRPMLVWIPDDLEFESDVQRGFVFNETEAVQMPHQLEIVRSDLAGFKDVVVQALERLEKMAEAPGEVAGDSPKSIYLVYGKADRADSRRKEIVSFLRGEGLEVLVPTPDDEGATVAEILEDHRQKLRTADGILIYYGTSGSKWLEAQNGIVKPYIGKGQPVRFYLGPPETGYKRYDFAPPLGAGDAIAGYDGAFDPALLSEFVAAVKAKIRA